MKIHKLKKSSTTLDIALLPPHIFDSNALITGAAVSRIRQSEGSQSLDKPPHEKPQHLSLNKKNYHNTIQSHTTLPNNRRIRQIVPTLRRNGGYSTLRIPPYNIEKINENNYRISMTIAGFRPENIEVELKQNRLIILNSFLQFCQNDFVSTKIDNLQ